MFFNYSTRTSFTPSLLKQPVILHPCMSRSIDRGLTSQSNYVYERGRGVGLRIHLPTQWALTRTETSIHGAHSLSSLAEDSPCQEYLLPQECWRPWLGIVPAKLSSITQRLTNRSTVPAI